MHEVANVQFAAFVNATGYITVAKQALNSGDFPNVSEDLVVSGAAVFSPPEKLASLTDPLQWWKYIQSANWAAKGYIPGLEIHYYKTTPVYRNICRGCYYFLH
ncbi:hypothetical protein GCM10027516_40150 [Niabella aquatica]